MGTGEPGADAAKSKVQAGLAAGREATLPGRPRFPVLGDSRRLARSHPPQAPASPPPSRADPEHRGEQAGEGRAARGRLRTQRQQSELSGRGDHLPSAGAAATALPAAGEWPRAAAESAGKKAQAAGPAPGARAEGRPRLPAAPAGERCPRRKRGRGGGSGRLSAGAAGARRTTLPRWGAPEGAGVGTGRRGRGPAPRSRQPVTTLGQGPGRKRPASDTSPRCPRPRVAARFPCAVAESRL